eukprot:CAMPEP_0172360378 /NCGR_PEP_ID=MMETSP1060-20121228/4417_1 /TAXON_ID=37318 /ORGANISM="Pseudo-nitzschia pungens, Strain cf. cingulata" /LENGTH=1053 /DNA_ID=CAMNT_0013082355 /DNA_START=239 /DNA_END=3400 /DNA_ORIENTATION=+
MSSTIPDHGHATKSKKLKKKNSYQSPFRIKIGCLVALRYRPRRNNVQVASVANEVADGSTKWEPVATARFSEVWTDPQRGRDDGLALIGSRIRCFFPKTVLSEPYNAASRLLEGTVVNVVLDRHDSGVPPSSKPRRHSSMVVDLLIDNKNDRTLSTTLPFLKRVDDDGKQKDSVGKVWKESEERKRQYEERIKGGKHKAVVRVTLSNGSGGPSRCSADSRMIEAKWVIRKRVPTKIVRRDLPVPVVAPETTVIANSENSEEAGPNNPGNGRVDTKEGEDANVSQRGENGENHLGSNGGKIESKTEREAKTATKAPIQNDDGGDDDDALAPSDSEKNKRRKTAMNSAAAIASNLATTTSLNKDFSLPVYLGDGNDSSSQQEGNWRWEAGRYHNPHNAIFADPRPISKELLKILSYNFVGEVVGIQPTQQHQQHLSKTNNASVDTLAMVTIRLMILPEHTCAGRRNHHGPLDVFESSDLNVESLLVPPREESDGTPPKGIACTSASENAGNPADNDTNDDSTAGGVWSPCLLRVPIEELVIVHRAIHREDSETERGENEQSSMSLRYSYSFRSDTYSDACESKQQRAEEDDKVDKYRCLRCQHRSPVNKRLAGVSHPLCELCVEDLKSSDLAKWEGNSQYPNKTKKAKKYRCDCEFCLDRKHTEFLASLASEVAESETKLGSTLDDLKEYSSDRDSGFIATRFVVKGINPVDFTVSPSSLCPFMNSTSSKPITRVKARVSKPSKRSSPKKTVRDAAKRNGGKLVAAANHPQNRPFPAMPRSSRKEPFRSTSSRLLPYDVPNRKFDVSATDLYEWKMIGSSACHDFPEKPRNLRLFRKLKEGKLGNNNSNNSCSNTNHSEKKKPQGRAARAKQRMLLRSVVAMGVDVNTLAGRESNVRFDRSNIHGWGVFTDVDIREGEMIIEYRGEWIGNAMAEKREKEYEAAKIGSDYMFRVDEHTVCDATKQGNVARFINASCAPNCYPKIIFLDGNKRIVVYAKRDVYAGEELTYDYKFDLEYDPDKRIPCICGAPECRGFLNWDQRYVALPNNVPDAAVNI